MYNTRRKAAPGRNPGATDACIEDIADVQLNMARRRAHAGGIAAFRRGDVRDARAAGPRAVDETIFRQVGRT